MKAFIRITLLILSLNYLSLAASVEGKWITVDDKTKEVKSVIEIYIKDGKLYGTVDSVVIKKGESLNPVCNKCKEDDYRYNKPIIGMELITALTLKDGVWSNDDAVLDPDNGRTYDCKIWLDEIDNDKLHVRGYLGFFYRTQMWIRVH